MPITPKKILIMEDEKPMARALVLKLTHAGYEAVSANNGEEGLALLAKDTFDLILCDLVMPVIDGFKVLQALKDRNIQTPIIILTNLSQEEDERRAKSLGARDFIIKSDTPITTIIEKVESFLASK